MAPMPEKVGDEYGFCDVEVRDVIGEMFGWCGKEQEDDEGGRVGNPGFIS